MNGQPKPNQSGGLQWTRPPPNVEGDALHAERRQLTVAFVDIVGSTPLSERIDPEEFFAVIRAYRDICDEQIRRYGGHIARMIGDGLLAYFGGTLASAVNDFRPSRSDTVRSLSGSLHVS